VPEVIDHDLPPNDPNKNVIVPHAYGVAQLLPNFFLTCYYKKKNKKRKAESKVIGHRPTHTHLSPPNVTHRTFLSLAWKQGQEVEKTTLLLGSVVKPPLTSFLH
jgi:5-methylthioribose kinase